MGQQTPKTVDVGGSKFGNEAESQTSQSTIVCCYHIQLLSMMAHNITTRYATGLVNWVWEEPPISTLVNKPRIAEG